MNSSILDGSNMNNSFFHSANLSLESIMHQALFKALEIEQWMKQTILLSLKRLQPCVHTDNEQRSSKYISCEKLSKEEEHHGAYFSQDITFALRLEGTEGLSHVVSEVRVFQEREKYKDSRQSTFGIFEKWHAGQ